MDENRKSDEEIEWEIFAHEAQKRMDKESAPKSLLEIWVPRIVQLSLTLALLPVVLVLTGIVLVYCVASQVALGF